MSITVGNLTLPNAALLAPMAGITDLPFRRIAARYGAGLVISEMVASGELTTGRAATRAKAQIDPEAGVAAVQIAGREVGPMAEAARLTEDAGASLIDINMGCPAKKVTSGWSGSALMRDPDHALSLIEAVARAVEVPVTLKMRLGWCENSMNAPEIAARAEAAGVRMITIHGRTRQQFYKGVADWRAVAAVKAAVNVPVVVNGDIVDAETAIRARAASGADAVMIGRGAQGAPWTSGQIGAVIAGATPVAAPEGDALLDLIQEHYEAMLAFYGVDLGLRIARKHLSWYLRRLPNGEALRATLMRAASPADAIRELSAGFADAASPSLEAAA
ncbi:MAG: tRNA dihydrouridine synthase DusB, partial [Pseudomonadota bacterium]